MFAWLSSCPQCGYSLPPIYYLCDICWTEVREERRGHVVSELEFTLYALWEWRERETLLHKLLQRRKSGNIWRAEQRLARWLSLALLEHGKAPWDGIFYPAKNAWEHDHTWFLATALGQELALPVYPIAIAATPLYKTLGRRARIRERSVNTAIYPGPRVRYPILVDDIVTTGATLETLWVALRKPPLALGLSLAYKTFNSGDKI